MKNNNFYMHIVSPVRLQNGVLHAVLLLLLSACSTTKVAQAPAPEPVVFEERIVIDGKALPLPEEPAIRAETIEEPRRASPVVARLMASAQQQRSSHQWDAASSLLERALRIEPRNARLWSKLAEIKFDQEDWRGAIQVAAKSNTLSGSNEQLRRQNWYLMANAYQALGDLETAQRFRDKLI